MRWERAAWGLGLGPNTLTLRLSRVAAALVEAVSGCDDNPLAFVFNVLLWEVGLCWPERAFENCPLRVTSVYISGKKVT